MLEILFGWYIKKDMGCTFDTIVFTETVAAGGTKSVTILEATENEHIMEKLSVNDFIITGLFTACFPASNPVVCDIMPDGESVSRVFKVACSPHNERVEPPISIETGIDIEYTNNSVLSANVFIGFDGFWLATNMRDRFNDLADAVVGMMEFEKIPPKTMAQKAVMTQQAMMEEREKTGQFCKRRRL